MRINTAVRDVYVVCRDDGRTGVFGDSIDPAYCSLERTEDSNDRLERDLRVHSLF
jgi:hypothetical protein